MNCAYDLQITRKSPLGPRFATARRIILVILRCGVDYELGPEDRRIGLEFREHHRVLGEGGRGESESESERGDNEDREPPAGLHGFLLRAAGP